MLSAAESADVRAWQAPAVEARAAPAAGQAAGQGSAKGAGKAAPASHAAPPGAAAPSQEEIAAIRLRAREEGLEAGRRDGLEQGRAAGRAEVAAQAQHLRSVLDALAAPLRDLDDAVVEELTGLALTVARHLVRREIRTEPGEIVAVVRQAAAELPVAARRVRVILAPADAPIVRAAFGADADGEARWEIVEDPSVQRGDCRIESEHSRIDASVERRLAAIAAQVLGGERDGDGGNDAH